MSFYYSCHTATVSLFEMPNNVVIQQLRLCLKRRIEIHWCLLIPHNKSKRSGCVRRGDKPSNILVAIHSVHTNRADFLHRSSERIALRKELWHFLHQKMVLSFNFSTVLSSSPNFVFTIPSASVTSLASLPFLRLRHRPELGLVRISKNRNLNYFRHSRVPSIDQWIASGFWKLFLGGSHYYWLPYRK